MNDVLRASLEFPTILFTGAMAIAVGLWLLSLLGIAGDGGDGASEGLFESLGLGEVPITILLVIFAPVGWLVSVLGSVFIVDNATEARQVWLGVAIGVAALVAGVACTIWMAPKFGRFFETRRAPSKLELVGRVAEVRSATVTLTSGRAEAAWPDGTVSTIDIRLHPGAASTGDGLRRGDRALILDWVAESDNFIVDAEPFEPGR